MESSTVGDQYLERATARYALAQQQNKPEIAERVYEEARGQFEMARHKLPPSESLNERLARFHFDYGQLLRQLGKSQRACAQFLRAQACGHPEVEQQLFSSRSPWLVVFDRVHDTKQLAIALLREEHRDHLELLADQIFEDFIRIPADEKKEEVFVEIAALGAPRDRDLTLRFLSSLLEERALLFLPQLHALTKCLERAKLSHLCPDDLVKIMRQVGAQFKDVSKLPGDETKLLPLLRALTTLFATMADANVRGLQRRNLHQPLYREIEKLTSHPSLEIKAYAHAALQALVRLPHDEHKLAVALKSRLSDLLTATLPLAGLTLAANNPLSLVLETLKIVQNSSALLNAFQQAIQVQIGPHRWYDAWRFAQLLLETRGVADFRTFLQSTGQLFETTRERLIKGSVVLLVPYLHTVDDPAAQREVLDFFNEQFLASHSDSLLHYLAAALYQAREDGPAENVRSHAAAILGVLHNNPSLSRKQRQALAEGCSAPPPLLLESEQQLTTALFQAALDKVKLSFSWWMTEQCGKRLEELTAKLTLYVPLQGSAPSSPAYFSVEEQVNSFLSSQQPVLLLQGDAGAGKTLFCHHLERLLWEEGNNRRTLPWYVPLAELSYREGDSLLEKLQASIEEQFATQPPEQFKEFQKRSLLFLLDGYDELKGYPPLVQTAGLFQEWPRARFLITCRHEALTMPNYRQLFRPTTDQRLPFSLEEISLVAPSWSQIECYLGKHLQHHPSSWSADQYLSALKTLPSALLYTPLLLRFLIETLPTLSTAGQQGSLTRSQIYDAYTEQWLKGNRIKLRDQEGPKMEEYTRFAQDLAYQMLLHQQVAISWSAAERKVEEPTNWKTPFLGNHSYLLRLGIPLFRSGSSYSFLHASLLEYFAADKIFISCMHSSTDSSSLSNCLLTQEGGLLSFLADRVHRESSFQERLFACIEASKNNPQQKIVSANALTILNFARIPFSGLDLRGIQVPGAYLDHAVFDHTDLRRANLRGCSLRHAFLREARLERADLEDISLGEQAVLQHESLVFSVCFSPDGQQLASASEDDTVRLWEVSSWQELQTLRGHEDSVSSVCFSPAGQQLASASDDGTVRLWEVSSGQELQTLRGQESRVWSVCFSPAGQQLASACYDGTVRLWEVASGQELQTLRGHEDRVWSVCFSPAGQQLASASYDRTVRLWEVASGQELQTLRGHEDSVLSVCFSPAGQQLASASLDGTVRLWEVASGQELQTLRGHEDSVLSVCFSPAGQQLASASLDGTVRLWEVASGQELQTMRGHEFSVESVCFSPAGQQLASAGSDKMVKIWRRREEEKFVLQWSTPHALLCQGMQIGGAYLSAGRRALLLQKGAIGLVLGEDV